MQRAQEARIQARGYPTHGTRKPEKMQTPRHPQTRRPEKMQPAQWMRRPERARELHHPTADGMTFEMMQNHERHVDPEAGQRNLNPSQNYRERVMIPKHSRLSFFVRHKKELLYWGIPATVVVIGVCALIAHAINQHKSQSIAVATASPTTASCTGFGCGGLGFRMSSDPSLTSQVSSRAGSPTPALLRGWPFQGLGPRGTNGTRRLLK